MPVIGRWPGRRRVSVDTMRHEVAGAALAAGAALVNDVSGGLADPASSTWWPRTARRTW